MIEGKYYGRTGILLYAAPKTLYLLNIVKLPASQDARNSLTRKYRPLAPFTVSKKSARRVSFEKLTPREQKDAQSAYSKKRHYVMDCRC